MGARSCLFSILYWIVALWVIGWVLEFGDCGLDEASHRACEAERETRQLIALILFLGVHLAILWFLAGKNFGKSDRS